MYGYIEMLFVNYCSHMLGEYCYQEDFIETFQDYAVKMIQNKSPSLPDLNEEQMNARNNKVSSYNPHERVADENEITEEFLESNIKKNEFSGILPGDISVPIDEEDFQEIEEEDMKGEKELEPSIEIGNDQKIPIEQSEETQEQPKQPQEQIREIQMNYSNEELAIRLRKELVRVTRNKKSIEELSDVVEIWWKNLHVLI